MYPFLHKSLPGTTTTHPTQDVTQPAEAPQESLILYQISHQAATTTSRPILRPFIQQLDTMLKYAPRPLISPMPQHLHLLPQNPVYSGHIGQGQYGQVAAVSPCTLC